MDENIAEVTADVVPLPSSSPELLLVCSVYWKSA